MTVALPDVLAVRDRGQGGCELELQLAADLDVLEGHFPEVALVPGVAQIDWAVRLAREHTDCQGRFSSLRDLKFLRVIEPPVRLRLALDWDGVSQTLSFDFQHAGSGLRCASGRVAFDRDDG